MPLFKFPNLSGLIYGGNSTMDDVNEENNSSFNTFNPINTTVEDEEEKKSSINEDKPIDNASSTPGIDGSIKGIASLSLESTATDLLKELRLYWSTTDGVMKPEHIHSGWSMIETLATVAVSKASLMERHGALLLASAIMRIALDIFASRGQLEKPLNSETIERLLFKPESEHVPVALKLLNWILSDKMNHPALTEKMNDDFDFLAALKSQYLVSRAQKAESIMQADASSSAGSESYDEEKVEKKPNDQADEPNFYMQVAGRLSLVGRKFDVTLDEIRRRVGQPECLNISTLARMLKKNDEAKRAMLEKLTAQGIELPFGRRNQVHITALTALLEEEAIHLASDLEKITASYYPIDALVEYLRNKWTEGSHEVETLRRDLLGASRILREIRDVILCVGCPIGSKNPPPFHDEALQLAFNQYSLITHGFGVLNQRTWIRQFAKLAKRTSLCYRDNSTMVDLDDENNLTLNTADQNITTVDGDEKKSLINEDEPNDIGSSMTGIDTPIKGVASLSLESRAEKDESIVQSVDESSQCSQSTETDLLKELSLYWSAIDGVMKPDDVHSGWSMIETLASFAVSNASLMQRHDALLLASAIMRIALDIFASHDQLENSLSSENIELLLFKPESEHVPVALELLNWILSDKMNHPALTEKMNDVFDFLATLKSQYLVSRADSQTYAMQVHGCFSLKGVASLSLESRAEKDESIMQADASPSADSEAYAMQIRGCFSLIGSDGKPYNIDVTLDEIRRRIGEPECLNINTLTGMLKKIDSAAKREELRKILKDWGIELPVGRKEGVTTALTALREGDAIHLDSGLDKITASYYPIDALVEHLRNKWTEGSHDEVETRRRDLLGASRILREIRDVIFRVECPIGNHNPPPFHDETLQLAFNQYSLRTHGFGVLNQRTWIRQFTKLTERISDKMTDTTASHV